MCSNVAAAAAAAAAAALSTLVPQAAGLGISFGRPSVIGKDYSCTGFQGFDNAHALGLTEGGWRATSDGGKSWTSVFEGTLRCTDFPTPSGAGTNEQRCLRGNSLHDGFTYVYNEGRGTDAARCGASAGCWCCRCPSDRPCTKETASGIQGELLASVLMAPSPASPDAVQRHDLGSVHHVADKSRSYTSFNSTRGSTVFTARAGVFDAFNTTTTNRSVVFKGIPEPGFGCGDSQHSFGCPFRTSGRGYVKLADGTLVMSVIVWWGGAHANPDKKLAAKATSVVAFRSSDGGYTWTFAGSILDASQAPQSEEGPNENDLALLADDTTILCVVRLDAGDGPVSHPYRPYMRVLSTDGGYTWTNATSLAKGVGCARPRLLRTDGGSIVLAGGRLGPTNRDTLVWLNSGWDTGAEWEAHSITYWHNRLEPDRSLHFTSAVNSSSARQTMSYTSLVRSGPQTGFIVYARRLPGTEDVAFSMPFAISR